MNTIPLFMIRIYGENFEIPTNSFINIWHNESRSWGDMIKMWGKQCYHPLNKFHSQALWCVDKHPCTNIIAIINPCGICLCQLDRDMVMYPNDILSESIYHFISPDDAFKELECAVLACSIHVS